MSLHLGNIKIKELYLGSAKIKECYLGSTNVYNSFGRVKFVRGTNVKQTVNFGGSYTRTEFSVLPDSADVSQLCICHNGINTSNGVGVFWVTKYSINSAGNLYVKGYKAAYNSTSWSNNSGWPSPTSNAGYYYASQTFGGVSTEAHKYALDVPANAVAVLFVYRGNTESALTCNVIQTDIVYRGLQDAKYAICKNADYNNTIWGLAANTEAEYNIDASDMVYPLQSNNTVLVGSKNYLTAL